MAARKDLNIKYNRSFDVETAAEKYHDFEKFHISAEVWTCYNLSQHLKICLMTHKSQATYNRKAKWQ